MKKQIHNVFEDIKMDENRKREIWEQLEQSNPKTRRFNVRKAIVAAACLVVFEFSARKVGPKVYIFLNAIAYVSPLSCPDTVRFVGLLKKSFE